MARPGVIQEVYNMIIKEIIKRGTIEGYRLIELIRKSVSKNRSQGYRIIKYFRDQCSK